MASFADTAFSKNGAFDENAFDFGSGPPPTPPAAPSIQQIIGGGVPSHGTLHKRARDGRSRKEIEKDRERFGIPAQIAEIVAAVAVRQAETLVQDEQKRFEELLGELKLRELEFDARYLEALNIERQRLIDQEIGLLIKRKLDESELIMVLLAAAAAVM